MPPMAAHARHRAHGPCHRHAAHGVCPWPVIHAAAMPPMAPDGMPPMAARAAAMARHLRQHLLGGLEGEVVQEHHHLLPVGGHVLGRSARSAARRAAASPAVGTWLCIQWVPGRAAKS